MYTTSCSIAYLEFPFSDRPNWRLVRERINSLHSPWNPAAEANLTNLPPQQRYRSALIGEKQKRYTMTMREREPTPRKQKEEMVDGFCHSQSRSHLIATCKDRSRPSPCLNESTRYDDTVRQALTDSAHRYMPLDSRAFIGWGKVGVLGRSPRFLSGHAAPRLTRPFIQPRIFCGLAKKLLPFHL